MRNRIVIAGLVAAMAAWGAASAFAEEQAYLGLVTEPVTAEVAQHVGLPEGIGVVVRQVEPEGPADGVIQPHDILVRVDDQWVTGHRHLAIVARQRKPGETVRVEFRRRGQAMDAELTLGGRAPGPLPPPEGGPVRRPGWAPERPGLPPAGLRERLEGLLEEFRPDERRPRLREPWGLRAPGEDPPFAERRVEQRASLSFTEVRDGVAMTLQVEDGRRRLRAVDADGEVLFDGPVNTREEIDAMPEELRERFREMVQRTRVRAIVPPPPAPPVGDVL